MSNNNNNPKQLKQKDIKITRDNMLIEQNNRCYLCGDTNTMMCLDHAHASEPYSHQVRHVLCRSCNSSLGFIWKVMIKQGLVNRLSKEGAVDWLHNAALYYQEDYSNNSYHVNRLKDETKRFKALNKPEQIDELKAKGIIPPAKANKAELTKLYKSSL